jgi:dTDP-glucose pyrophosphorylase/CBS domain-containing protein
VSPLHQLTAGTEKTMQLDNIKKYLLSPDDSVKEAMRVIDEGQIGIAMVVNEDMELLGVVTDSDIRKSILRGVSMEEKIGTIMNRKPVVTSQDSPEGFVFNLMRRSHKAQIPIVDEDFHLRGIATLSSYLSQQTRTNPAVILAGGLGMRLRPLTLEKPKPLLTVGEKPILHTMIEELRDHGFRRIFISTNYMAEQIERYFKDGSDFDVNIEYVKEAKRLGTAGPLSLLRDRLAETFLVLNGDLLTKVNYSHLLEYHISKQFDFTVCVAEYHVQVPYGVVHVEDSRVKEFEEKPVKGFFVNAGIYVINPEMLRFVPDNAYFDMPKLMQQIQVSKGEVGCFPIREYWSDIGNLEQFEKSNQDYWVHFGNGRAQERREDAWDAVGGSATSDLEVAGQPLKVER